MHYAQKKTCIWKKKSWPLNGKAKIFLNDIKLSYSEVIFTQLPKGHFADRFSQKVNGCALGSKLKTYL